MSIIVGIILIALLISMIIINHRAKYEKFFDHFAQIPASVNDPYVYFPTKTNSIMTNSIFTIMIIVIFIIIFIIAGTANSS
jgi:hypothetical protein